jgi:hypothetical protein
MIGAFALSIRLDRVVPITVLTCLEGFALLVTGLARYRNDELFSEECFGCRLLLDQRLDHQAKIFGRRSLDGFVQRHILRYRNGVLVSFLVVFLVFVARAFIGLIVPMVVGLNWQL